MRLRARLALLTVYIVVNAHSAFIPNYLYAKTIGHGYDKTWYPSKVNISVNLEVKYVNYVDTAVSTSAT